MHVNHRAKNRCKDFQVPESLSLPPSTHRSERLQSPVLAMRMQRLPADAYLGDRFIDQFVRHHFRESTKVLNAMVT